MKKYLLCLFALFTISLANDEDFIDDVEYGKKLYENPRGISCSACHGEKGEGKKIANYHAKGKAKQLKAPKINALEFEVFMRNINASKGVMPKYYLTQKEIMAIYKFLKNSTETKE